MFQEPTLNGFMSLGRPAWSEARSVLKHILSKDAVSVIRWYLGWEKVSCLEKSPQLFRGVLIEGFHCVLISLYLSLSQPDLRDNAELRKRLENDI